MTRTELRAHVIARSGGRCEWPGCDQPGKETAHLEHRKMGGRKDADTPLNAAWLCLRHHDQLDGRFHPDGPTGTPVPGMRVSQRAMMANIVAAIERGSL